MLRGRREAYAELVRAHQAKVLRLCTALLNDPTQAEDAAQDVFFKAYQALASFRQDASFSTWLYRITTNHCRDLLRKRSRRKEQSFDALVEDLVAALGHHKVGKAEIDELLGVLGPMKSDIVEKK